MRSLWIGFAVFLLGALPASAAAPAVDSIEARPAAPAESTDAVDKEYRQLLVEDDAAQIEVDQWIKEHQTFEAKGVGGPKAALSLRVQQRLDRIVKAYEDFLKRNPRHVPARLAFGSLLDDLGREADAKEQWEKATELDPNHPAAWNNLANYYGHNGPVTNAFRCYEKAIALNPREPVYYQNLATTTFLYRSDAKAYYGIDEQKVFDRSLDLYRRALELDPRNFVLASELAQTYYGIKPSRLEEAVRAWEHALQVADDPVQREGVHIHLARHFILQERFGEARQQLALVTNAVYQALKDRLTRNLEARAAEAGSRPKEPSGSRGQ